MPYFRLITAILLCCIATGSAIGQEYKTFEQDGKWGLETSGKTVLAPLYGLLGWSDGAQPVVVNSVTGYRQNSFWGLLSLKGKKLTPPTYLSITHQGGSYYTASAVNSLTGREKYGLLDNRGKVALSFNYREIRHLTGEKYVISEERNGKTFTGLVEPGKNAVIPVEYSHLQLLDKDILLVSEGKRHGVFTLSGDPVLPVQYDRITITSGNNFLLEKNKLLGLADREGHLLLPVSYKQIKGRENPVTYPQWLVRNADNSTVDTLYADSVSALSAGKLLLFRNGSTVQHQVGIKTESGIPSLRIKEVTSHGHLIVNERDGTQVLKKDGSRLLPEIYDSVYYDDRYYYARMQGAEALWVAFTLTGRLFTPFPVQNIYRLGGDRRPGGNYTDNRVNFKKNGYWGTLDFNGEVLFVPEYDTILPFYNNRAIVSKLGKYGLKDGNNQWMIYPYEDSLQKLSDNAYLGRKGIRNRLYNRYGRLLVASIDKFSPAGNKIIVTDDLGKKGLMNLNGFMITSVAYDSIAAVPTRDPKVKDKIYLVSIAGRTALVNDYEDVLIPLDSSLQAAPGLSEDKIAIRYQGKYGFVNLEGKLVIANRYDSVSLFSEGLAGYRLNGLWGFLDVSERLITQPYYQEITAFRDGLAAVKEDGRWGLINQAGEVVVAKKFRFISRTSTGKYIVKGTEGTGLYGKDGSVILYPIYESVMDIKKDRVLVKKNGRWGILNYQGIYVVPTLYKKISYLPEADLFVLRRE